MGVIDDITIRLKTIKNHFLKILKKIYGILDYTIFSFKCFEVHFAKKSKDNWEQVEGLFRMELSNLIEDNPYKLKILDYALFYLYCRSMAIHFGGFNAGKAGYMYLEKETMDYIYYLIKYGKEKELSAFEKGVDLLYEIKNSEKIREKVSDDLKEYVLYCCFNDINLDKEKSIFKKMIKDGYSGYYITNSPSYFYRWDKKYYKTYDERIKRDYDIRKILCDKGYFPEIYRKYYYIIYDDYLKEEKEAKQEPEQKESIIKRLFGLSKNNNKT